MTRQNYGDRVRRTQSHWQRENGDEREPPSGYVPYEDAKRQHERGANGPSDHNKHQSRIKLVPFDEIRIDTSRPYLIKGLIPLDGLTVIWGPPKSGKAFGPSTSPCMSLLAGIIAVVVCSKARSSTALLKDRAASSVVLRLFARSIWQRRPSPCRATSNP